LNREGGRKLEPEELCGLPLFVGGKEEKVMRDRRKPRLIWIASIALVVCSAVFWSLLNARHEGAGGHDVSAPPHVTRAAAVDRPGPEVRVGRVLKLDEFIGLNPELYVSDPALASLLKPRRAPWPADGANSGGREQLASMSPEQGRGDPQ
jgi:hypothetical protein